MPLSVLAILTGLPLLLWSAGRFVDASAVIANHFRISPLVIGMLIVGFGTSMPEMIVSALAASQGNPGIALGNAIGSNITNIALILGLTAIICPIAVKSSILKKELPILTAVTFLSLFLLWDQGLSRLDAIILLVVFFALIGWTFWVSTKHQQDNLAVEVQQELEQNVMSIRQATMWSIGGMLLLVVSSRALVWGAIKIATQLGVSDLFIGLTIIAVGTSLPELASSIVATQKQEHDIALGNVLGSNLFNTLAVIGIAGAIHPMEISASAFYRDIMVMTALTLSLFVLGYGIKGRGSINRFEGGLLLCCYLGYTAVLLFQAMSA